MEKWCAVQDVSLVRSLMQRHVRQTGSPLAKSLLSKWETVQPHFVKIYPHEYRHAMEEAEKTKVCAVSFSMNDLDWHRTKLLGDS